MALLGTLKDSLIQPLPEHPQQINILKVFNLPWQLLEYSIILRVKSFPGNLNVRSCLLYYFLLEKNLNQSHGALSKIGIE